MASRYPERYRLSLFAVPQHESTFRSVGDAVRRQKVVHRHAMVATTDLKRFQNRRVIWTGSLAGRSTSRANVPNSESVVFAVVVNESIPLRWITVMR